MRIRSFIHKGLQKLYLEDRAKSLPRDTVEKLRAMLKLVPGLRDQITAILLAFSEGP